MKRSGPVARCVFLQDPYQVGLDQQIYLQHTEWRFTGPKNHIYFLIFFDILNYFIYFIMVDFLSSRGFVTAWEVRI